VSTDTTKAMEEALQAAVARMSQGDKGPGAMPTDPIGLIMTLLPKLLSNDEEREDLVEKLEGLEKESFAPLQEQIRGMRKQLHRVAKVQEEILEALRELREAHADVREQQTAVGNAVLHLAEQMARVEILADEPEDPDDGYEPMLAPSRPKPAVRPGQRSKRR